MAAYDVFLIFRIWMKAYRSFKIYQSDYIFKLFLKCQYFTNLAVVWGLDQ